MATESFEPATDANAAVVAFSLMRAPIGLLLATAYTALMCTLVIISGALGQTVLVSAVMHLWGKGCLWIFGIRVEVEGEENLPSSGGGIVVFNHQSHFDIPALSAATRKTLRYGAKIELFKIPIFGAALRSSASLPIARNNRNEVLRVYREAEAKFAENFLFCLAPEGTRQSEPVLGRFKKGPFVFAMSGGVPVIPVVIKGAYPVLPKGSLLVNVGRFKRTVHVRFLKPVPTAEFKSEPPDRLTDLVRAQMVQAYDVMPEDAAD